MKKTVLMFMVCLVCACTHLTRQEEMQLRTLKGQGVSVDKPVGSWEKPANPAAAAALNILPGIGNFYLAAGNGGDSTQYLYGTINLLLWPISILWGIPEAALDANRINERELIYYYQFDPLGKKELAKAGINMDIE